MVNEGVLHTNMIFLYFWHVFQTGNGQNGNSSTAYPVVFGLTNENCRYIWFPVP